MLKGDMYGLVLIRPNKAKQDQVPKRRAFCLGRPTCISHSASKSRTPTAS